MHTKLFNFAALVAALGLSGAALAQDGPVVATVDGAARADTRMGLKADGETLGIGAEIDAAALSEVSGLESWLIDSALTSEDGLVLATIRDLEYSESGDLTSFVVEVDSGLRYSLPAEDVKLRTTIGSVTTTRTMAELDSYRHALDRLGDAIEDAVDGDQAPEDRGVDHTPDANDVDDPEIN
jgi:hypothetical protein